MNKIGETIYKKRTELGLTQAQLAAALNVSYQSVSKWENNAAYPDIEKLPELAALLKTSVDVLLGYRGAVADYDSRYAAQEYYWGLRPNRLCFELMSLLPPVRPYRVLDVGCGGGRTPCFWPGAGIWLRPLTSRRRGSKKQSAWRNITAST